MLAGLLWAFWPSLVTMAQVWFHDSQYSHGLLVPLYAVALLWLRRGQVPATWSGSWWGLALLAAGLGQRVVAAYIYQEWLSAVALLPCLAGAVLLVGGWPALRWAWPGILFLVFMVPLPYTLHLAFSGPLQFVATNCSVYCLETVGIPTFAEGNIIVLTDGRLGVEDVCSGLAMLLTFFTLAVAMAIVLKRPLVDRIVLIVSAFPVALLVNTLRITTTGILHETVGRDKALLFHEHAGWFMMPLALLLFFLVLSLLARLFRDPLGSVRQSRPLLAAPAARPV
jgi:exosortase